MLSAALVLGSVPRAAAQTALAAAPASPSSVSPADALAQMRKWGVFKDDHDVLKTYLGDSRRLTPLGQALYLSLVKSHDPQLEERSLRDDVISIQPQLDKLRQNGPYDDRRQQGVARTLKQFQKDFGSVDAAADGSVEGEFKRGALREALMTGAATTDPPKAGDLVQVKVKDGYELWDKDGLAYRTNNVDPANPKNNATTYNREMQKQQRQMNQMRPPEVPFIPETGRYNPEMFDYSYYSMKDQYDAIAEGMRRDRVMALAELLGKSANYRADMLIMDKRIEADLEAEARTKTYRHHGKDYNLLEIVDAKFKQRKLDLEAALTGLNRYKTDMEALKAALKSSPVIGDAQAQNLALDEQGARRLLTLGVLDTQVYFVRNQIEHLDPSAPDAEQVMTAIDNSGLSREEKARYKLRAEEMVNRLHALDSVLDKTRTALSGSDYAASMDMANAALTASQRELGMLGTDYAMFVEVPSLASMDRMQGDVSWMNWGAKISRGAWRAVSPGYAKSIAGVNADGAKLGGIARLIADGKIVQARQAVIALNPDATKTSFSAALNGDPNQMRITDAARLAASLKVSQDRINSVFQTNKWLDAAGTFVTWTGDVAVSGPILRRGLNGAGQWLGRYTGEAAAGEVSSLSRLPFVRRPAIVLRETFLHTGARLQSLDPDAVWIDSHASNVLTRTMLATTMRAGSVAMRQASFTAMSGGISGVFTAGQHLWSLGSEKLMGPGKSATAYGYGIRPSDSMFSSDWQGLGDAFWAGAKGGIWWANSPMYVHGVPLLPGMLGYIGLPSTAFRDTRILRYAELVGARGVMGSGWTGTKWLLGLGAAPVEGAVEQGYLERLAMKGWSGSAGAFALGMTDNIAKYQLFSNATGWVGNQYAYHWAQRGQDDLSRRIEGANQSGQNVLMSPLWMLIPTFAAHQARDAALYQRSTQGAEQYRAAGREHEIANAEEGARLRFVSTPDVPISQRIFDASLKSPEIGDYFIVTKELRREAIKHQMVSSLGGEKATPADINPMKFYQATKMADGANFINLKVNDEVRLIAHQDFVEALLADPARAKRVLDAPLGSVVDGFGRVTPEVQKDVAVGLYSSDLQIGKPMPAELSGRVNEILKPYLDANLSVRPKAEALIKALDAATAKSEAFGAPEAKEAGPVLKDIMSKVSEWRQTKNPDEHPYTELVSELRADADALRARGKLSDQDHAVLVGVYDYIGAIEERFNAFNNVEKAHGLANESIGALKTQYAGNAAVTRVLDDFSGALEKWAGARGPKDFVAGPRSDGSFKRMIDSLAKDLEKSRGALPKEDFDAMKGALNDIGAAPWVLHDSKGSALPGWRPVQFEGLMGTMTAIVQQGRGGSSVRLFQMVKTGGGKTMLTFEGLLPLVEADGKNRGMQPMFLTVQSNLEAQGRLEFIAYKKIGSNLKFDTYEGFKTKIAEGKTKGKNALRDYWILGDEMDGAALQPALTIGQVTGGVSRRSPVYNRVDELDTGLANRLTGEQSSRDARVRTESRRALNELASLDGTGAAALKEAGERLDQAAGRLKESNGPESRRAAVADVRDGVARIEKLLNSTPSSRTDVMAAARESLGRLREALDKPSADAKFREGAIRELEAGFTREENLLGLTGSEQGLSRLSLEARKESAELEGRVAKLTSDIEKARASKAPGASERLGALRDELDLSQKELAIVGRFRSEDAGQRLANLQEKIAEGTAEPGGTAPQRLAEWKSRAAEYEGSLPSDLRPTAKEHADALRKEYDIGREIRELDGQIADAARAGRPADDLKVRRAALDRDYTTVRVEAARLKTRLTAGIATSDLGGMLRRLEVLKGRDSSAARAERASLLKSAEREVRARLAASADDVTAAARGGKPGWEDASVRLLERRRQMMAAFAGDENPMYTAFRGMKDDMQGFAMNQRLKSSDEAVYKPAQEKLLKLVDGKPLLSVPLKVMKLTWEVFRGRDVDVPIDQVGLTRLHAAKMLKALFADPTLPDHQRDAMFWSLSSSLLWPGHTGKSSWVRTELLRQLHGFDEDPAGIRLDNRTGKINVVHNGQWFESMDNETRRFWELEYGVDLTLPYTNSSISTIKDVTTDKKARFISFSGTAGEKLREHFEKNEIRIEGEGSKAPPVVDMDVVAGPTNRFARIGEALSEVNSSRGKVVVDSLDGAPPAVREAVEKKIGGKLTEARALNLSDFSAPNLSEARDWLTAQRERTGDADSVVLRRADAVPADAKPAIDAYLSGAKLAGKDDAVVRISAVKGPDDASTAAAQTWLRTLRSNQKDTGLIVLSLSDTRVVKMVREYLTRVQGIKPDEIVSVFSDTEYLRNNVPEANVAKQMNLDALNSGKARVLILDTRVGGRGLDLNFKGERGSLDPKAFRGYTDFQMLIVDPQKMSQVHLLQAEGRIDVDRVLAGARRDFSLVMDVKSVQDETVFRDMIAQDPFFSQLRADPKFVAFETKRGGRADWAMFHDYIRERSADGTADGALLAEQYQDAVKKHLEIKQGNVEEDQLRSSSVLTDAPRTVGRYPGIEGMR